jgi:hypothetical protein
MPKPRRAGLRWRENAPDYVLDCFDHPNFCDRYAVFFVPVDERIGTHEPVILYLGMSDAPTHPQGFSQWGEIQPYQLRQYRFSNGRYRVRWLDLPEHIRAHVRMRWEQE